MTPSDRPLLRPAYRAVACGMAAIGVAAAGIGLVRAPQQMWPEMLVNDFYILGIGLGGTLFIAVEYLSAARWCAGIRRIPEALMSALPPAAVLLLTIYFGRHFIYQWSRPDPVSGGTLVERQAGYLDTGFFFLRMTVFLALWIFLSRLMRRRSLRQDAQADALHRQRMVRYSAIFVVVFAITFSLASFDWLMSVDPHWSSTIFAVYMFSGLFVQGLAAITLVVAILNRTDRLPGIVGASQLRDLGTLLFAFTTFWAYIWVSQYLLIWYSNLPEEIGYYLTRTRGAWNLLFLLNPVINWVVPFLILLPRSNKSNPVVLLCVSVVILLGRWVDIYLAVMPAVLPNPSIGVLDVAMSVGYAGLLIYVCGAALARAPLVPVNDPALGRIQGSPMETQHPARWTVIARAGGN